MSTPNEQSIADSMETNIRLLPHLPFLLQDLWALGSAVDQIMELVGTLDLPRHSNALDLGCGKGAVSVRLASRFGFRMVGVDAMAAFLADARAKADEYHVADLCEFKNLDILDFTSQEHDFDLVILASLGGVFGSFKDTVARLRTQVRTGGYMLIDDGYLKESVTVHRKGYDHYHHHADTLADLTAFGDVLLREISTTETSLKINDEYQRLIEKRGRELIELYPEVAGDISTYVSEQAEECQAISDHLEGAAWLVQKRV